MGIRAFLIGVLGEEVIHWVPGVDGGCRCMNGVKGHPVLRVATSLCVVLMENHRWLCIMVKVPLRIISTIGPRGRSINITSSPDDTNLGVPSYWSRTICTGVEIVMRLLMVTYSSGKQLYCRRTVVCGGCLWEIWRTFHSLMGRRLGTGESDLGGWLDFVIPVLYYRFHRSFRNRFFGWERGTWCRGPGDRGQMRVRVNR